MLRYTVVANWNTSNCCIVSKILGIGEGFWTIFLLNWRRSVRNITVTSFFAIMSNGVPYSDCCTGVNTTISMRHTSYFWNFSLLMCDTGMYLLPKGLASGLSLIYTGYVFYFTSVTSERSSKCLSRRKSTTWYFAYNLCADWEISLRLDFSYLLSRILQLFQVIP